MFCMKCGTQLPDEARFCSSCGYAFSNNTESIIPKASIPTAKLVPAKCTSCNASLDVDPSKDAALCPYCGTPFIVEKAIQQFITTHKTINNIQTAIIQNGFSEEKYVENGIMQIKLERYQDALNTFEKMSQDYPNNWKSWFGISVLDNIMSHTPFLSIMTSTSYSIIPQQTKDFIGDGYVYWEENCIMEFEKKKEAVRQEMQYRSKRISDCNLTIRQNDLLLKTWKNQKNELEEIISSTSERISEKGRASSELHNINLSIARAEESNRIMYNVANEEKGVIHELQKKLSQIEDEKQLELSKTDHKTVFYYIDILKENVIREV